MCIERKGTGAHLRERRIRGVRRGHLSGSCGERRFKGLIRGKASRCQASHNGLGARTVKTGKRHTAEAESTRCEPVAAAHPATALGP